jgi:hypothetical protein
MALVAQGDIGIRALSWSGVVSGWQRLVGGQGGAMDKETLALVLRVYEFLVRIWPRLPLDVRQAWSSVWTTLMEMATDSEVKDGLVYANVMELLGMLASCNEGLSLCASHRLMDRMGQTMAKGLEDVVDVWTTLPRLRWSGLVSLHQPQAVLSSRWPRLWEDALQVYDGTPMIQEAIVTCVGQLGSASSEGLRFFVEQHLSLLDATLNMSSVPTATILRAWAAIAGASNEQSLGFLQTLLTHCGGSLLPAVVRFLNSPASSEDEFMASVALLRGLSRTEVGISWMNAYPSVWSWLMDRHPAMSSERQQAWFDAVTAVPLSSHHLDAQVRSKLSQRIREGCVYVEREVQVAYEGA